jgi:flagellar motor component MotA
MKTFSEILEADNDTIIEIYLDWVNNFISLDKFADHYGLDEIDAHYIIDLGRKLNEEEAVKNYLKNELISEGYESEEVNEFLDEHFQNLLSKIENKENFINWIN